MPSEPSMSIDVLDHGFVTLDNSMADDLSVVNSARVSFAKRSEYERNPNRLDAAGPRLKEADAKLIGYLMKNRHGTPFEHNSFRFHVKAPLFIFREWQRHRIGSFNEWSARYSELKPEFYIPELEDVRTQTGKPGAYTFETILEKDASRFTHELMMNSHTSFVYYQQAINDGVAKELARLFLPVNIYSEMFWTVNARSLMNFLSLRNSNTAMLEIKRYAEAVEGFLEWHMPMTHAAFVENGRVAP